METCHGDFKNTFRHSNLIQQDDDGLYLETTVVCVQLHYTLRAPFKPCGKESA